MAFRCTACGREEVKWSGRCPACGAWGTLEEAGPQPARRVEPAAVARFDEAGSGAVDARIPSGLAEFDRVLGGGWVPGEVALLSGEPGIGKSTLALALAASFARTLYACGEESMEQVRSRIDRMGIDPARLVGTEDERVEAVLAAAEKEAAGLVVLDSVQTLRSEWAAGPAGSPTQVRAVAEAACRFAKSSGVPVLLVGHVTKEGEVAGPMLLSHLVDCVLLLEPDESGGLRILRSTKNRFGATEEAGFFHLVENGIEEVEDPEAVLLSPLATSAPGRVRHPSVAGRRVILVEVEALVLPTRMATPRRVASGFDAARLATILAVLERRVGLRLTEAEVYLKTSGGYRMQDPAADLAAALAVASAYRDRPVRSNLAAFGEVGLSGDLRPARFDALRRKVLARRGLRPLAPDGVGDGGPATLAGAIEAAGLGAA